MADGDRGAGGGVNLEPDDADDVLPEVENPVSRRGLGEGNGLDFAGLAHGFVDLSAKFGALDLRHQGRRPVGLIELRLVPVFDFSAGVIGFAQHEIRREQRTGVNLPTPVGHDALHAAVGVRDFQLPQRRGALPHTRNPPLPMWPAYQPLARSRAQRICAGLQDAVTSYAW